ncbi:uncharacterized protein FTOL_13388 [Fusarium torulosum]|uniref:Uncharacterized protein n=1 Tax=Fusarium torulosum TaxID=33205 RepID=A0AAE8MM03_9HYPO|nr:uncharacterized protein FTOL_13388 [Fusarium torulosum]
MDGGIPLSVGGEYIDSGNVGYSAATFAERSLVQQTVASSLEHMADQNACNRLHKRVSKGAQDTHIRPSEEMYEWQQELEEVYDALHNKRQGILVQSKQMRDKIVALDDVGRVCHLQAEGYKGTRFMSAWDYCLKKWEETTIEQTSARAEWQIIINN